jgi:hypothetical protein
MKLLRMIPCGQTPILEWIKLIDSRISKPPTRAVPDVGLYNPHNEFMVVDFPAPLGLGTLVVGVCLKIP